MANNFVRGGETKFDFFPERIQCPCTAEGKAGREGAGKEAGKERKRGRKRTLRGQVVPDFCQSPPHLVSCIQYNLCLHCRSSVSHPILSISPPPMAWFPSPPAIRPAPESAVSSNARCRGEKRGSGTLPETLFFFQLLFLAVLTALFSPIFRTFLVAPLGGNSKSF